jgi:hypothetical protein
MIRNKKKGGDDVKKGLPIIMVLVIIEMAVAILCSSARNLDDLSGAAIPDDIDESVRSVIYHEWSGGSERLVSVGPSSESQYSPDEWKAVLLAVEMGLVNWDDEEIKDGEDTERDRCIDLSTGSFFTNNTTTLAQRYIYTNSNQIKLFVQGCESDITFYLYDYFDRSTPVDEITISSDSEYSFTGLNNQGRYYLSYVLASEKDADTFIVKIMA